MLLRTTLLQALLSVRSERRLAIDRRQPSLPRVRGPRDRRRRPASGHFTHNRERLGEGEAAPELIADLVRLPEGMRLMSAEFLPVNRTMIEAAVHKELLRQEARRAALAGGTASRDFRRR